jgi:hypothetical protein
MTTAIAEESSVFADFEELVEIFSYDIDGWKRLEKDSTRVLLKVVYFSLACNFIQFVYRYIYLPFYLGCGCYTDHLLFFW